MFWGTAMKTTFDHSSVNEILAHARRLERSTVRNALDGIPESSTKETSPRYGGIEAKYNGKGGFGQFLEEIYFGKKNDSLSQPDFPEAGLELKTAPLIINSKHVTVAKERVVLGLFSYHRIVEETFEDSHLLSKNASVLLVFYFHDALKALYDLEIPLVDIWECLKEDGTQIRADWEAIVRKVRTGLAHEISEGDTYYLGACTKGATKLKSQVSQPYSDMSAQARAFCFKVGYVTHIYRILVARQAKRTKTEYIRLLDEKPLTLEQQIQSKFSPYIGRPVDVVCREFALEYRPDDKGFYAQVARAILGIRKKNQKIYEFDAANIQIKTIRVEPNGKAKEQMSFPTMKFCEIADQDWEDSDLYQILTSKFFFVIYKHYDKNAPYRAVKIIMWNMPERDLEIARQGWEDTKLKIIAGHYKNFIKISDAKVIHVRPHGMDNTDLIPTPQGTMQTKKSFWLNKAYLIEQLKYNEL